MDEASRLEELKFSLAAKVERLTRSLGEAKRQYDAIVTSLELLDPLPSARRGQPASIGVSVDELSGKNLKDALLYIAEKSDGILRVTQARRLLVEAEIVRPGQSGSNRVNAILGEMHRQFQRIPDRKGRYRLIDDESEPKNETEAGDPSNDVRFTGG